MVTYFFVPDMTGRSPFCRYQYAVVAHQQFLGIDLADEDRKFMEYLIENGWEGDVGEEDDEDLASYDSASESGMIEKK